MDGPRDEHTTGTKTETDMYDTMLLISGIQNMTQMNIAMKWTQTHRQRADLWVPRVRDRGKMDRQFGICRCKFRMDIESKFMNCSIFSGFPHSSVGKESARNARDPGLIPGLGRSAGEGIGYPFQYSWASLVAQLVKNSPTVRETWVRSLGWEDPLEKRKATHPSILAWRIPWTI